MKNKKLAYLLVPLVLLIWGHIIYKLVVGYSEVETVMEDIAPAPVLKEVQLKTEAYELYANYADPFLKRQPKGDNVVTTPTTNTTTQHATVVPVKVEPKPVQEKWPDIEYKGSIINNTTKEVVAMMSIDKKNQLLKKNDSYKELTLVDIATDSVVVAYHNTTKSFHLKLK